MKKKNVNLHLSEKKARLKRFFGNRKLRCGALSVALTSLMIVLVLCVNFLASSLENAYALTIDCSYNALTTQSETTKNVLNALERDVRIYLLDTGSETSLDALTDDGETLRALLRRYAAASSHVTYSEESLLRNPTLLTRFQDMLGENEITTDCMIIACEETGRARILNEDDYQVYSYTSDGYIVTTGYQYERLITEAILYVSQDELPTLQFLTGHGELTEDDTATLETQLISNNYYVKRVTLSDTLDESAPLFILSPQYDFSETELEALYAFAKRGGNFFVISHYSDPVDLPNFNTFLSSYGIVPLDGLCVAEESDTNSYYSDAPAILLPYMQETETTASLISGGNDILLLTGARAFDVTSELSQDLTVEVLLKSGQAYLRTYQDGAETLDKQEGDREGVFNLAVLSTWTQTTGDRSKLFIIGNANVFTDDWLYTNTSASKFLMQLLSTLQSRKPINLDIVQKPAARDSLSLGSLALPMVLTLLLPLLIVVWALLVLLPRRNL